MTVRLTFERNLETETIDVSLSPDTDSTSPLEQAWGKKGLGYAQKVAEQHTFELNRLREDKPCFIDIDSYATNEVQLTYMAEEANGTIGGLSSATLAMSSIVFTMMQEALGIVGDKVDIDEGEDFYDDFYDDDD